MTHDWRCWWWFLTLLFHCQGEGGVRVESTVVMDKDKHNQCTAHCFFSFRLIAFDVCVCVYNLVWAEIENVFWLFFLLPACGSLVNDVYDRAHVRACACVCVCVCEVFCFFGSFWHIPHGMHSEHSFDPATKDVLTNRHLVAKNEGSSVCFWQSFAFRFFIVNVCVCVCVCCAPVVHHHVCFMVLLYTVQPSIIQTSII